MPPLLARRPPLSVQLIGVDGGATEVKVRDVAIVLRGGDPTLRAGANGASELYARVPGFETPAERGLTSAEHLGPIQPAEREQGWGWIEATTRCVLDVARRRGAQRILVGVAMPGLKTPDGRGIAFALNGPRIPKFAEHLENALRVEGFELAMPIARLESDGWCCGLGEEWAEDGLLRGVDDAYYVGGGTGVAEALRLRGEWVHIGSLGSWFPRVWELRDSAGETYERVLSAAGINRQWTERTGFDLPLPRGRFPEDRVRKDERAQSLLALTGARLGFLLAERAFALWMRTNDSVPYPGPHVLQRVVIGQRLGELLADERTQEWFRAALDRALTLRIDSLGLEEFYPPDEAGGVTRNEWLRCSSLREAPILGAAAAALLDWSRAGV